MGCSKRMNWERLVVKVLKIERNVNRIYTVLSYWLSGKLFLSQLSAKRVNDKDDKDDNYISNNKDEKGDNCINNKDEKDEHGDSDVDSGVGVDWCY